MILLIIYESQLELVLADVADIKDGLGLVEMLQKILKIFLNTIQKISLENSLSIPRKRIKNENISLTYDVTTMLT